MSVVRQGVEDVVAAEPARKTTFSALPGDGKGEGAIIVWIRLVGDESAIVAGFGVASEGEVEAAIGFRTRMACISNIPITLLVARYSCQQEF